MKEENQNYLRMSLADLESSKILYLSKKYPQSIFLLQQSVEKTTKGITGIFKHSHKTLEIYKEMVDENLKEEIGETFESAEFQADNEKAFLILIASINSLLSNLDSSSKVEKITSPNIILQHILSQHASSTRYPKEKHNPLTKYTKDYFLIKHYNKLYDFQRECLNECFKFIPTSHSKL